MSNEKDIEKKIAEKLSSREYTIKPEWKDDMAERLDKYNKSNKPYRAAVISIIALLAVGTVYNYFNPINISTQNNETLTTEVKSHSTAPINNTNKATINSSSSKQLNTYSYGKIKNPAITNNVTGGGTLNKANTNGSKKTLPANRGINLTINLKSSEMDNQAGNSDSESKSPDNQSINHHTKKDVITANIYAHNILLNTKNDIFKTLNSYNYSTEKQGSSKTSRWELGLIMGPSITAKKQLEGETAGSYFNISLNISNRLSNKLRYNTGLNYSNYGEQLKYEPIKLTLYDSTFEYRNTFGIVIDSQFNPSTREWEYDTSFVGRTDTIISVTTRDTIDNSPLQANGKTTFTYLEVPLSISYPIIYKSRYSINLIGGGSVGYLIKSSGNYYRDNRIVKAQSQKVIYNAMLGAGFDYDIGHNLNFRTQAIFKRNLSNLGSFNTTRRYTSFGIKAGLVYKF